MNRYISIKVILIGCVFLCIAAVCHLEVQCCEATVGDNIDN